MLIGFKSRFAPFVQDGTKTHTIRAARKIPPKVGEMCHCYVNPRQKTMRLLGRWPCVRVEDIQIGEFGGRDGADRVVYINGHLLDADECATLAWRDGFRSQGQDRAFFEMMQFWEGRERPFLGHVIHWKWAPKDQPAGGAK
jgi:hypothetical protein